MSTKLKIHLGIFIALILYCVVAWKGVEKAEAEREAAAEENYEVDEFAGLDGKGEKDETVGAMVKVGIPMVAATVYGGFLFVAYLLPALADRFTGEMMGSTAEVEDDPMVEARRAVSDEDYPEAIRLYREIWLKDRTNRKPVELIYKLQREKMENPAMALMTLEEALKDGEWEDDDQAFLMFRIAEIQEKDLKDEEALKKTLQAVVDQVPNTRHSANASHRLRELAQS